MQNCLDMSSDASTVYPVSSISSKQNGCISDLSEVEMHLVGCVYTCMCSSYSTCLCGVIAQTNIHSSQKSDFLPQKLDYSEVSLHCRHVQRTK